MNEQAKSHLAAQLASIANRARKINWPIRDSEAMVFITRGEVDFGFDVATNEDFEGVLSDLLKKHRWSEKFSEGFLRDKLFDWIEVQKLT
ncbi:MAG: hypothetical protein ABSD57_11675 [Verrucomicrobiota bacterium]|jgi:hypothetical protein